MLAAEHLIARGNNARWATQIGHRQLDVGLRMLGLTPRGILPRDWRQ